MNGMHTRRQFLASASAAAAPAILRPQSSRRPNILFCISDDQSWIHTGINGTRFLATPGFDRVAREGVLFRNCFVSTPSCAPSRASVLTGQDFYRLGPAAMNHTEWRSGLEGYPDLLSAKGYHTGFTGKGWGPGNWRISGRSTTPCGDAYNSVTMKPPGPGISDIDYAGNFQAFLAKRNKDTPFCFWAGFLEPHRIFDPGIGVRHGKRLQDIQVPGFLPDTADVRKDLADYAFEIEWYDRHLARMLDHLAKTGELENTLVVATSDNGMAFPRAKGNLYEYGVHMPLAVRWGAHGKAGRTVDDFVSFTDFAPTFLRAAGLPVTPEMTGRELNALLDATGSGQIDPSRNQAVFGIERHFPGSRPNGAGYPSRGIRTGDYLYIWNLAPDRNPAGDNPGPVWPDDDPTGGYGDTDGGLTKSNIWQNRNRQPLYFRLAFAKRPAEELYSVRDDPFNVRNLASSPAHEKTRKELRGRLEAHLRRTRDPRILGRGEELDAVMRKYPSISPAVSRREAMKK
jgi:uncharacterized sulfatase